MGSEFVEPKPFSIDENSLENILVNIGNGSKVSNKATSSSPINSKDNNHKDFEQLAQIMAGLSDDQKSYCIALLEKYAFKFNMNIVCKNTSAIGEEKCSLGSKEKEILYNNFSLQGPWTGLEVIISGDDGLPIVARSKGQEWDNCSKSFKISKI